MRTVFTTIVISILALAVLGGAGYWFIKDFTSTDGEEITTIADGIDEREESNADVNTAEVEEAAAKVEVDMAEEKVQIYLHRMTHQKIVADKKIGAVEMSGDNIDNMLKIVRENYDAYEHSAFYEENLTAWQNGDFSNAVSVHNTIWDWHGGTVGRATGLMTKEQEAEYVEKHFR
ncbi:MAG TPA: DUF6241 domain-containing protein [Planococcus sp. (in: firmicutes)]|nr:DUF6241 domain-containing protein [Planococcus sp. (in: firmicutes)]